MKMRTIHFFAAALVVGCATSCVEENLEKDLDINNDPKAIRFGVTSQNVQTKTVYGTPDDSEVDWPLYWVSGDQIHIFCPDAEDLKFAGYTVTPNPDTENNETSTTTHKGTISQMVEGEYLQWSGDSNPHDFYAAYPYGKAIAAEQTTATKDDGTEYETAYITFSINNNQVCEIPSTTTSGNYVAAPQMSNAYMVACTQDVLPSDDAVELDFKPIMTTLVVKVTAPTMQEGDNSGYNATITGLSVISEVNSSDADKGQFVWDAAGEKLVHNKVSGGTKATHTTFVGIKHGNNQFVDLKSGETLTMTVFLPPIVINDENPVQIKLHVAGSDFSAHLGIDAPDSHPTNEVYANVTIAPSKIRRVNLPMLPSPLPSNSNWITPLDDDIYVSQLSIPGTHDACTGDGTSYGIGQTQDIDLEEQWNMGIRCFDLRPRVYTDGELSSDKTSYAQNTHGLWINHGAVSTKWSMDAAIAFFKQKLEENPGELVIVIMRHETEGDSDNSAWADLMATALQDYNQMKNTVRNEGLTVNFRPDLTIGDCRGKILFLCRSWTSYTGGPTVGGYTDWSHDMSGYQGSIWGPDSDAGIFYIQDYYAMAIGISGSNYLSRIQYKQKAIRDYMDIASTFHTNISLKNAWMINHASGYTYNGYEVNIGDSKTDLGLSTTNGYRNNAKNNNPMIYNYLTGGEVTISSDLSWPYSDNSVNYGSSTKAVGPTGIIMLDFVGTRTSGDYNVYGDLCPQAIIDNNYKYRMKRKGE